MALLGPRLQECNFLANVIRISISGPSENSCYIRFFFKKMLVFLRATTFFGLMAALKINYKLDWKSFIDSPKSSLKAVLLPYWQRVTFSSVGHAVNIWKKKTKTLNSF